MPVLTRRLEEESIVIINAKHVLFHFNAQLDCQRAKCTASGEHPVRQERTLSGNTEKCIEHESMQQFILNTHTLHNAHLIRAALPRNLTVPIPYALDWTAHHQELAQQLRVTQTIKRTATAEKAAEKRKGLNEKQPTSSKRRRTGNEVRNELELEPGGPLE
ncbi:hypothetical protein D9615_008525 [Tricholomella constricta]|uniref:Uncharacterized protein n=1 Tax=Tricholomella constricta TaxID=117010 RepID=A0A8H5M0M7_9AGAR|nr:hypothetical protein D9615_008525 [Tricholomella constricta]